MSDPLHPSPLRRLAPGDAPYPGDLVAGDPPVVWTSGALWQDDRCWDASGADHLLAPVDLGQSDDGPVVAVPHCPHRLGDWLVRRTRLGDGEIVTLGVSILRGSASAHTRGVDRGEWWVTSDGRPVLAGVGTQDWRQTTREMVAHIVERAPSHLAEAVSEVSGAIASLGSASAVEELEARLFAAAEPAPLATEFVSLPARHLAARAELTSSEGALEHGRRLPSALHGFVDHPIVERLNRLLTRSDRPRSTHSERARPRTRTPRSRRPLLVAAAAMAAVIVIGVNWPDGDTEADGSAATGDVPRGQTASWPSTSPPPSATKDDGMESRTEVEPTSGALEEKTPTLAHTAGQLIETYAACAASCDASVVEDPHDTFPSGVTDAEGVDRTTTVVERYGGVAVLRIEAPEHAAQYAVIVRSNDSWLIRDVFDVADQP